MIIRKLFDGAIQNRMFDLQALIMFLVFEKQVLTMEDDAGKLDLYFIEKHNQKMNKELMEYKHKMKIKYDPQVYEVSHDKGITYILAKSIDQARVIANRNLIKFDDFRVCSADEIMSIGNVNMTIENLVKNSKVGILGGY